MPFLLESLQFTLWIELENYIFQYIVESKYSFESSSGSLRSFWENVENGQKHLSALQSFFENFWKIFGKYSENCLIIENYQKRSNNPWTIFRKFLKNCHNLWPIFNFLWQVQH